MKTNKGITDLEATAASAGALQVVDQVLLLANAALHHPNQRLGFLLAAGHQPRCLAGSRRHELPNIHRDMIPHASKSPPTNFDRKMLKTMENLVLCNKTSPQNDQNQSNSLQRLKALKGEKSDAKTLEISFRRGMSRGQIEADLLDSWGESKPTPQGTHRNARLETIAGD